MLRREGDNIVLCGKGKCCPTIKRVDDDTYVITDDDGGTVKIKKDQVELIPDAVKAINGEQLILG